MTAGSHRPADLVPAIRDISIAQALAEAAAQWPDRPALMWPVNDVIADLTYAELFGNATDLAQRLRAFAVPGEHIAAWAPSSADWLVLEYAVAIAGMTLVPFNPALTDDELGFLLQSSESVAIFGASSFRGSNLVERATALAAVSPAVRRVIDIAAWHALPTGEVELGTPVSSSVPFLIQYTSGTTGKPKGAILSQRAALNAAATSVIRLEPDAHEIWCSPMPLHHVGGSVSVGLGVLSVGGTLVLMPSFDPAEAIALIERTGATILGAVPTMMIDILNHPTFTAEATKSLRVVQIGGSNVTPALIERIEREAGVLVSNAYGQSEAPNLAQTSLRSSDLDKAETIGTPNPHREVLVVSPKTGEVVPLGVSGELWVRSELTMTGYHGEPERTISALDAEGWLHTGDLVTMDERGVLRFAGRLRDVIIRGGENVYPAEVEAVLIEYPAVADAAVVASQHERWGEEPAAFIRVSPGQVLDVAELEAFARTRLASFKVPRRWVSVEQFPLTPSGKVQRFALQKLLDEPLS